MRFTELSLSAQTLYAQVHDAAQVAAIARTVADVRGGSFVKRKLRGRDYWYFQHRDLGGVVRMAYVGPDSKRLQALIEKDRAPSPRRALTALAQGALGLGCAGILRKHYRAIERLDDYGFFRAGGVLIGTHAFLGYGNMYGVRWGDGDRTQDIDFAHPGKALAIALPADIEVQTHTAIESLEMGLVPITGADGKAGATYLNPADPELRLDFLTVRGRGGDRPVAHPKLGVVLQPLPFLEYLLEAPIQLSLLSEEGAVLVNVPEPARYAVHKLVVWGERPGAYAAKSRKDLAQAAALLARLRDYRAREVEEAWHDLLTRGPGWRSRALRGLKALDAIAPDLCAGEWLAPARPSSSARPARTTGSPRMPRNSPTRRRKA